MTISSIRKWICLAGLGCLAGCLMMDILGGHAPGVVLSPSEIPNGHLTRGRLNGKYSDPIHVLWSPRDSMELGALADGGYWNGGRWAQVPNNPAGYWVYVDPYWIVYRSTSARSFPGGSFSGVWESNVGRMTIALQQRTVLGSWTNHMGTWRFQGTVDGNRINLDRGQYSLSQSVKSI